MKRVFTTIIFFILAVSFAFADEFSLFPWACGQKEVFNYCVNKGWEYSSDVSDSVTTFYFTPSKDVTYHGNSVYKIRFSFDNDKLIMQTITFSGILELDMALAGLLENVVQDKARLIDKEYTKDELYSIQFVAELNNSVTAKYFIVGQGNAFQNSIAYIKE